MTSPRATATTSLSCRVPIRLMEWLDAQALEQGRTRSNMITVLLLRVMDRQLRRNVDETVKSHE